jgi:uncharacterized protein YggE
VNRLVILSLALCTASAFAQVIGQPQRTIQATGDAQVSVAPDLARVQVSVVSRAATADEASQANATRAAAVIAAIRQLIGSAGEIRTAYYNVMAYSEGNPPRQAGFQVTNSLQVTILNLQIVGRVLDAAIAAGANRVDSLSLGLRDDDPSMLQALQAAGSRARARAEAIARGLGVTVGRVLHASEGGVIRPLVTDTRLTAAPAATTPIETGSLTITAHVTVEYEVQ